jgi:hypothetical protein
MQRLLKALARSAIGLAIGFAIIAVWDALFYLLGLAIHVDMPHWLSLVGAVATLVTLEYYADKMG